MTIRLRDDKKKSSNKMQLVLSVRVLVQLSCFLPHPNSRCPGAALQHFSVQSSKFPSSYSKTVSTSRPLYPLLYLSFTDSSKRFPPLYLIPLQHHPLYLVLYTSKIHIRDVFCFRFLYIRIYHTFKYHVHILF